MLLYLWLAVTHCLLYTHVMYKKYKALRSAGGIRPLRPLSRKYYKNNVNETDRQVHDFRCKLPT